MYMKTDRTKPARPKGGSLNCRPPAIHRPSHGLTPGTCVGGCVYIYIYIYIYMYICTFHMGWFQNNSFAEKQHGKQHRCDTDTTCNNMSFETAPFETTPYASPQQSTVPRMASRRHGKQSQIIVTQLLMVVIIGVI